jgi:hypothetical protein
VIQLKAEWEGFFTSIGITDAEDLAEYNEKISKQIAKKKKLPPIPDKPGIKGPNSPYRAVFGVLQDLVEAKLVASMYFMCYYTTIS